MPKKRSIRFLAKNQVSIRQRQALLICPNCKTGIPSIAFINNIFLYLQCPCHYKSKMTIHDYVHKINSIKIPDSKCTTLNHQNNSVKYCSDCEQWSCKTCLHFHKNHCQLDYSLYIICPHHFYPFSHYCYSCNWNICKFCLKSHLNHQMIRLKIFDVKQFFDNYEIQSQNKIHYYKSIMKIIKTKIPRNEISYQLNQTINTRLQGLRELEKLMPIFYNTAKACFYHPCYELMNIFKYYNQALEEKLSPEDHYYIHYRNSLILSGHSKEIKCILQLNEGQLASSSCDNTIKLWNVKTTKCIATLVGHTSIVNELIQLNDGKLASCSRDNTIILWSQSNYDFDSILIGHTDNVTCLMQLNKNEIASGSSDKNIRIWNPSSIECIAVLSGHTKGINQMILLKDNHLASSSDDCSIRLWDISTYQCNTILLHYDLINYIMQLTTGKIASASDNRNIKLWSNSYYQYNGSLIGHTGAINHMIDLTNDKLASASSDHTIILWHSMNRNCITSLKGHSDKVLYLILLKNGEMASSSADKSIRFWNTLTYECNNVMLGHKNGITMMIQFKNNRLLVTASSDTTIRLWKSIH